MENAELEAKVHELEKALAVQQATMSGAQATQAASQAGMTSTMAATHGGTWATMVAGSVSLIVGIIVGIQIAKRLAAQIRRSRSSDRPAVLRQAHRARSIRQG